MAQKIYQIDAFADRVFLGNPAAVCPLTDWLSDEVLLKIASENNLSETAFYVPRENSFEIRWFTPTAEVDLCGHATLAAAYVIRYCENYDQDIINFYSPRSGKLPVSVQQGSFILNFPADQITEVEITEKLLNSTDKKPVRAFKGKTDYMLVFEKQEDIETIKPNLALIAELNARGVIVTAKGSEYDFVSRFFAPAVGVNEDPVCGSAHTSLTPYWAKELNKKELKAFQLSDRTGKIYCKLNGNRVELGGTAVLYLKGEIFI